MATYQNANQAFQTPVPGQVSLAYNLNVKTCRINPSSTATVIQAGTPVKLIAAVGSEIYVDVISALTDGPILGLITYNTIKNTYAAGDLVEVGCAGTVMYLESGSAINRGVNVSVDPATTLVDDEATATHFVHGVTLGQVAAANTLVLVEVRPGLTAIPSGS